MEPINVSRENFPMSFASAEGMIAMTIHIDNYEIYYKEDIPP